MDCYSRALELFSARDNRHDRSMALSNLGLIYQSKGEFSLAEDYLQKSLEARDEPMRLGRPASSSPWALTAQLKGDWELPRNILSRLPRPLKIWETCTAFLWRKTIWEIFTRIGRQTQGHFMLQPEPGCQACSK